VTPGDGLSAGAKILKHPLTLLLLGGLLTAVVGPFITRTWQTHERELEVKSELVDQMSQATAALMTSVHVREFNRGRFSGNEYLDAFRQWDEQSQVIDARLATYFPGNKHLSGGWRALSLALFDYYNLGSENAWKIGDETRLPARCSERKLESLTYRPRFLCGIGRYLDGQWDQLAHWRSESLFKRQINSAKYRNGWRKLKYAMIERRDELVRQVIASDASV
jgi:hypothetical protein